MKEQSSAPKHAHPDVSHKASLSRCVASQAVHSLSSLSLSEDAR